MHELTRKTADEEIRLAASNDSRSLADIQSQPRLQRVAGFLGELYQSALAPLKDKAVVQFNSFAESVTPLSDPARPDSSLQSYLRRNDEGKGGRPPPTSQQSSRNSTASDRTSRSPECFC